MTAEELRVAGLIKYRADCLARAKDQISEEGLELRQRFERAFLYVSAAANGDFMDLTRDPSGDQEHPIPDLVRLRDEFTAEALRIITREHAKSLAQFDAFKTR